MSRSVDIAHRKEAGGGGYARLALYAVAARECLQRSAIDAQALERLAACGDTEMDRL